VAHLSPGTDSGNGFLFEVYDSGGLSWAMDQAMEFYALPETTRHRQIQRIMEESVKTFNHDVTARHYMQLYEKMLHRPLIAERPY
jgi:starch synthase/alpha-amylase